MYHFHINVYGGGEVVYKRRIDNKKSDGVMQSLYFTRQIDSSLIEVTIEFNICADFFQSFAFGAFP